MSRLLRRPASVLAATALLGGAITVAAPAAMADPADVDTTMCPGTPVWVGGFDDSDAGQAVHGLTTTSGTTPEAFDGEFISTVTDPNGNDIYLFNLSGSRITKANGDIDAGIWAGISGSPVYDADENLIGSVSYGFTQIDGSQVAGITPAENIFATEQEPENAPTDAVAIPRAARVAIAKSGSASASSIKALKPLRVAVGTGAKAADHQFFAKKARGLTQRDTDFGTAGSAEGVDSMVDGGNIATSWTSGDTLLASVGTITAVCGDKVFAFGHPDEGIGDSKQTMHSATTVQIIADGAGSYKIANINPESTGALINDGNNGIFGVLGRQPEDNIPVVTTTTYGAKTATHTSQASEPAALSTVVANQVFAETSAVLGNPSGAGAGAVTVTVIYRREGSTTPKTYARTQFVTEPSQYVYSVIDQAAGDVDYLSFASDEDITITGVNVSNTVTSRYLQELKVNGIQIKSGSAWKTIKSGATIKLKRASTLSYRTLLGPVAGSKAAARTTATQTFKTPNYASVGKLKVLGTKIVLDEGDDEEFFGDEGSDIYDPELTYTFDDVLADLKKIPRNDRLVTQFTHTYHGTFTRTATLAVAAPAAAVSGSKSYPLSLSK